MVVTQFIFDFTPLKNEDDGSNFSSASVLVGLNGKMWIAKHVVNWV